MLIGRSRRTEKARQADTKGSSGVAQVIIAKNLRATHAVTERVLSVDDRVANVNDKVAEVIRGM
jgi:hypothetical protein